MSRRSQYLRRAVLTNHFKSEPPTMLLDGPWSFGISVVVIFAFKISEYASIAWFRWRYGDYRSDINCNHFTPSSNLGLPLQSRR